MAVTITIKPFMGWDECVYLENEKISLVASLNFGPRILSFSIKGKENIFYTDKNDMGFIDKDKWHNYGGHRLWHSPQIGDRPNQLDNDPVVFKELENGFSLKQKPEQATGIEKEIEVLMDKTNSSVKIIHRMTNKNLWPIEFSVWALSMMKENGTEILPIPQNDTHYLPNYMISFWPWTKLNDKRFVLGDKYMLFHHDPEDKNWFKIGYENHCGWGAYIVENQLFIKRSPLRKNCKYPDYASNFETYMDERFLELETLSPLYTVAPQETVEHEEEWEIYLCDENNEVICEGSAEKLIKNYV